MSAINELREGLARTETAQFVTTMLRDISATRLQSIRSQFEANERYFAELHERMRLIKEYAADKGIDVHEHQKGRVYVALTANRRFYGTLNNDVMTALHAEIEGHPKADGLVVGQTGKQIVERTPLPQSTQPTFFAFAKDQPTPEEVHELIGRLSEYAEVKVVHPTFINAFRQDPKVTDITHVPEPEDKGKTPVLEYLVEPDIPAMLEFFKTQIRLVLFDRIVLETRLALTGARLMKMQRARERAEDMLVAERRLIHKEMSTMQSMRLLETFTGYNNENVL